MKFEPCARQATHFNPQWHGTKLEPGIFYGADSKGYFVTWGALRPKGGKKVILVKRKFDREWRIVEEPFDKSNPSELLRLLWKCAESLNRRNAWVKPQHLEASDLPHFKRQDAEMRDCIRIHKGSGGIPAYRLNSCNL